MTNIKLYLKAMFGTMLNSLASAIQRDPVRAAKVVMSIGLALLVALIIISLGGCATPGGGSMTDPIVDTKGVDQNKYQTDLAECRQYAQQTVGAAQGAMLGAALGYALGYGISRASGGTLNAQAGRGSAIGGAALGAGQGLRNERQIMRNCLSGRGYRVLN